MTTAAKSSKARTATAVIIEKSTLEDVVSSVKRERFKSMSADDLVCDGADDLCNIVRSTIARQVGVQPDQLRLAGDQPIDNPRIRKMLLNLRKRSRL